MFLQPGWSTYLSYGLPATIQLCTEWWMYEVVIFMAGKDGHVRMGVYIRKGEGEGCVFGPASWPSDDFCQHKPVCQPGHN